MIQACYADSPYWESTFAMGCKCKRFSRSCMTVVEARTSTFAAIGPHGTVCCGRRHILDEVVVEDRRSLATLSAAFSVLHGLLDPSLFLHRGCSHASNYICGRAWTDCLRKVCARGRTQQSIATRRLASCTGRRFLSA